MTLARMDKRNSKQTAWHYEETIGTGATGDDIIIPASPQVKAVTCTLITGSNTGKFQISTSSNSKVVAGTAVWQDWDAGTTTGTLTATTTGPITGVRGVSVSGEVSIEVVV